MKTSEILADAIALLLLAQEALIKGQADIEISELGAHHHQALDDAKVARDAERQQTQIAQQVEHE